jgi:hypothetical protein
MAESIMFPRFLIHSRSEAVAHSLELLSSTPLSGRDGSDDRVKTARV